MTKYLRLMMASLILMATAVTATIYWNEARKEVVFLCGNFAKGVSFKSVQRQLDTGNLLRYRTEKSPSGSRITVNSLYSLNYYTCSIEFDLKGEVLDAHLE